jgi:hypothetical protein
MGASTRNPLHAKGEGNVLDRTLVTDFRKHFHKSGGFFGGDALLDGFDGGGRIAKLGGGSHGSFRIRSVSKQGYFDHINSPLDIIYFIIPNNAQIFNKKPPLLRIRGGEFIFFESF